MNEPDWIEHDGSAVCPVPDGHDCEMMLRCLNGALRGRPEFMRWEHDKLGGDITHYRDWTAFAAKQASAGEVVENPPAFPRVGEGFGNPRYDAPGMTLRDWFAGQALPSVVAATSAGQHMLKGVGTVNDMIAQDAYALADAMLRQRGVTAPEGGA